MRLKHVASCHHYANLACHAVGLRSRFQATQRAIKRQPWAPTALASCWQPAGLCGQTLLPIFIGRHAIAYARDAAHQLKMQGDTLSARPPHMRRLVAQQPQERRSAPSAAQRRAAAHGPQSAGREQPCRRRPFQFRQGCRWGGCCAASAVVTVAVWRSKIEEVQRARRRSEVLLDEAAGAKRWSTTAAKISRA